MPIDNRGKVVLVAGVTGHQGGAVARQLQAHGWSVRGLTRDPDRPAARGLAAAGVEVVRGDLNDRASLDPLVKDVYGVYSVQNFFEAGYEGEVRQGKHLADAAKAAGVRHFLYSSVGGAERGTGIPHFDSKWEIEQYVRALGLPATIQRPVFFMDNFTTFNPPRMVGGTLTLSLPLPPTKPLQMIATDDIGAFATLVFENPDEFIGQAIEIAGDELTMPEVAAAIGRVTGLPTRYVETPLAEVRKVSPETALMFEWFSTQGYRADIPALRARLPQLMTFEAWLRKTGLRQLAPKAA